MEATTQTSVETEIRALVGDGQFNRNMLTAMLRSMEKKEAASKPREQKQHTGGPCTEYTAIRRDYTCMHCGHSFSVAVQLKKGESVPVMSREGKVMIITSKSPLAIKAATSSCNWCEQFVHTLSREELEQRYMTLLSRSTFTTSYVQNLNTEKRVVVL
jgi:transcription elongation factor Elf1